MLTLRTLTAGDRAVIAEFLLSDPAHSRTCFDRDPVPEDADHLLSSGAYGAGPHAHALEGAFDADGTLVGLLDRVARWPTPATGYVGLLQVRPGHRGAGVGSALLAHAQEAARTAGCRQLMLAVIARHEQARVFWYRRGFRLLSEHRARTAGPLEALVMHRPIATAEPEGRQPRTVAVPACAPPAAGHSLDLGRTPFRLISDRRPAVPLPR